MFLQKIDRENDKYKTIKSYRKVLIILVSYIQFGNMPYFIAFDFVVGNI